MSLEDHVYKILYEEIISINFFIKTLDESFHERENKVKDFFILKEVYITRVSTLRHVLRLFGWMEPEGKW